jgi:transposase InsO family protein
VRGKVVETTVPDTSAPCPRDKVNRVFRASAPNLLWVSDITYVSTWQGSVYLVFVIDTFADRIVGWRVSRSAKTDFILPYRSLLRNTLPGNGRLRAGHA